MALSLYFAWLLLCGRSGRSRGAVRAKGFLVAIFADQHKLIAGDIATINVAASLALAVTAFANILRLVAKTVCHAVVKDMQSTFP